MVKILKTEVMKLKRTKILWLIPLAALLPILVLLDLPDPVVWGDVFNTNLAFINLLIAPPLFGLLAGYLFTREYRNSTINTLFSYPYSRIRFLLVKMFLMIPLIAATLFLNFLLLLIAQLIVEYQVDWSFFTTIAGMYLRLVPLLFAVVPIAISFGIVSKNSIAPMALGLGAGVCNIVIVNSKYSVLFPWSSPFMIIADNLNLTEGMDLNFVLGKIILLLVFIVPSIFNIFYYKNSNVHSG